MNKDQLKALQAPLKDRYRQEAGAAKITLRARGTLGEGISCKVETGKALVAAGLPPATGGDGTLACSGDMLLEALAACFGVTMNAVATALEIPIKSASIDVEGDLDFRGTLGVNKEAPVGFTEIRMKVELDTEASQEQTAKLLQVTERYRVVLQTLKTSPKITLSA